MPTPYPSLPSSPATFDFGNGLGVNVNVTSYSAGPASSDEYDANLATRLAKIKASGFDLVRIQILHRLHDVVSTTANPTSYTQFSDSANFDALFHAVADAGLRACVSVYGPRLNGLGSAVTYIRDLDLNKYVPYPGDPVADRFALFAGLIAERAEELHPGNWIWECGNEPNLETFTAPYPNLEGYLYELWRFGAEIKARTRTVDRPGGAYVIGLSLARTGGDDPNTGFIAPYVSPPPIEWVRALANHPAAAVIDAVGPHPYSDFKLGDGGRNSDRYFPEEESPLRLVPDLDEIRRVLSAPKHRTSGAPIEIVPTEWGGSTWYMPPHPLPSEIPAYTATLGATQRLKGTTDFSTGWTRYQGFNDLGIVTPATAQEANEGHSGRLYIGFHRNAGNTIASGYHSQVDQGFGPGDLGPAPVAGRWFGFAFQARSEGLDVDGRGTRIWAGRTRSKTNFELTTEWATYSGAFQPYQAEDGTTGFDVRTYLSGLGYHLRDVRVFDLSDDAVQTESRREAVQARFLGEIGRAAREAGCPAVFAYSWQDNPSAPGSAAEPHYGLTRHPDGGVKPALPALVRSWNADPEFDPSELGSKLAAWYDASFALSRFASATGSDMAVVDGPLGRLEDLSGNGRHLVRYGGDARRPTLVAANGRVKAVFDGTSSFMRTAAGPYGLAAPFLIGAMSVPTGGGDYATILGIVAPDGAVRFALRNRAVARLQVLAQRSGYTSEADLNVTRGTALRILAAANPPSGAIVDGEAFATTDPVPATETGRFLTMGGNIDGGTTSAIHLGEMMLLDGTPDVPTLDRIVGYLGRKWGI